MTNRVGRPTKYRPEMCERVIAMMSEGCSLFEVSADLDVRRETIWDWTKHNEEFSNAIKRGQLASQAWWEKQGRLNLANREFNHVLWFMNMKNRFRSDWRDKHEIEHSGDLKIEIIRFTPPPNDNDLNSTIMIGELTIAAAQPAKTTKKGGLRRRIGGKSINHVRSLQHHP